MKKPLGEEVLIYIHMLLLFVSIYKRKFRQNLCTADILTTAYYILNFSIACFSSGRKNIFLPRLLS